MKKFAGRLIAGVSAATIFVSAIGVDAFTNVFMRTVSADSASSQKNAKSTGFNNLEQDTDSEGYYNTGYGLHTNKTATEATDVNDGRTFDVNLESWYVGENPVDVATVLDASGSMAWTVDTLEPLEINKDIEEKTLNIGGLQDKYGITNADLEKYSETSYNNTDKKTKVLLAIQDKNDGYLPQEVVDRILDSKNTDNSKLGYSGYKYYVYEARSSVSEFVPLGYWDGGIDPKNDPNLIGYYPFSGDLKNKAPGAKDTDSGMLINHPASGASIYDTTTEATEPLEAEFSKQEVTERDSKGNVTKKMVDKGLNIADSASKGAILLQSPTSSKFSISFNLSVDNSEQGYDDVTILYLTDGTNYYKILRAGGSSAPRLKISTNKGQPLNANNAVNSEPRNWTFTFDFSEGNKKLHVKTDTEKVKLDNTNVAKEHDVDLSGYPELDVNKLKIYIGGDTKECKNPNNIYIKNVIISDIDVSSGDATEVANYPLETDIGDLRNITDSNKSAIFVEQAYNNNGSFGEDKLFAHKLDPVFRENKSLDVKATSQKGAVSLDAVPEIDGDGFTVSMKLYRTDKLESSQQNIFYLGDKNKDNDYYQYFRSQQAGGYLGISKNEQRDLDKTPSGTDMVYYQGGMASGSSTEEVWYTNTLVFEPDPTDDSKMKVTPYINGKAEYQTGSKQNFSIDKISVEKKDLAFLLCALKRNGNKSNQYLDDLYVFDKALTKDQVSQYFGEKEPCKGSTTDKALYHATTADNKDIAQISESLAKNTTSSQRCGWYYVNSHSTWADVEGCLASGKQYIGIRTDEGLEKSFSKFANDTATIPSEYTVEDKADIIGQIKAGNTGEAKYEAPSKERSIRFYVDSQNHLRCFVWTGDDTKSEDNARTFCSVVYLKDEGEITKYEELNNALNTFYQNLAKNSDLSNSAVVRFSTANMVDKDKTDNTDKNLKKLIMKDWTNWSDAVLKEKKTDDDKEKYLNDLLISAAEEGATHTTDSTARSDIKEYPYVMTGGTYTWTGLKAFYDNMVKKDKLVSGDRVYDIANDARDKYLIIFTDGRDNTQDYDVETTVSDKLDTPLAGTPDYKTGSSFRQKNYVGKYNPYSGTSHRVGFSIENYDNKDYNRRNEYEDYPEIVQQFKTGDHEIETDGDLAEAWADKLKDEGYTIYCVMMATGSISSRSNEAEYNKAYNFMKSLAGSNEIDEEISDMEERMQDYMGNGTKPDEIAELQEEMEALKDDKVIVVNSSAGEGSSTVKDAFEQILNQIQQPRDDYTVQDYIDPRFDLVDRDGNLYHLGAGGKITVTTAEGEAVTSLSTLEGSHHYTYSDRGNTMTVGNIIEPKTGETPIGLAYTPKDSYMVNRIMDTVDTNPKNVGKYNSGDGIGTGYIYYDDAKDMYYLRWEDQVIPMENEAFDTTKEKGDKKLDVWSATIRLKAKDDFIGGNNILTNGNEAGENLVYSDATIENMDKHTNYELYGFTSDDLDTATGKIPYRKKLEALSGTNRKINAVDADGVSQAVYGDGIDIPSSGFPRVTVNVRLKPLDAKNLNDVIYMGEVVSPTMMLADLENGYMTGSYYLEYLKRYAYRLYGYEAAQTPLLDLLNQWLKINDKEIAEKTFTIPYIYLPEPIYQEDGTLKTEEVDGKQKVSVTNSTGMSDKSESVGGDDYIVADFNDLNLRDVTGFITYTWKREGEQEPQQLMEKSNPAEQDQYDITKEYVVKDANQIKYNLQLKFTPLKDDDSLKDFKLDENYIKEENFFAIDKSTPDVTFKDTGVTGWTTYFTRSDYLRAMVKEEKTYEPHVMYDDSDGKGKWVLVDKDSTSGFAPANAAKAYKDNDKTEQTTVNSDDNKVTDIGVYDWDTDYKPVAGNGQIEKGQSYTNTSGNVEVSSDGLSLEANTTYVKDVVNGALALELVVDGKYLKGPSSEIKTNKEYQFIATRSYDDPIDPLPYGDKTSMNADTTLGKKYRLTFKVDNNTLPSAPEENTLYTVWAKLTKVEVENSTSVYLGIKSEGYTVEDAMPIGTYVIDTTDNPLTTMEQFKIGTDALGAAVNFKYLKTDNAPVSYTYDRFPEDVYNVSETALESTGDGEYLIKNDTEDNASKNIADSNREKTGTALGTQTLTFNFGTVDTRTINGTELSNTKGYSRIDKEGEDYAKDRLGIMLLSVDPNSLAISKEVTNTDEDKNFEHEWEFTITFEPDDDADNINEFESKNNKTTGSGFDLTWYKDGVLTEAGKMGTYTSEVPDYPTIIKFDPENGATEYKATIFLKHGEKVVISNLQEGKWQVTETDERETSVGGGTGIFYSAHNNMDDKDDYEFSNMTNKDIQLNPASHVDFVNEFPYQLPSTGSLGINRYIFFGTMSAVASVLLVVMLLYNRRKRRALHE